MGRDIGIFLACCVQGAMATTAPLKNEVHRF